MPLISSIVIFVQVKRAGRVITQVFDANVK